MILSWWESTLNVIRDESGANRGEMETKIIWNSDMNKTGHLARYWAFGPVTDWMVHWKKILLTDWLSINGLLTRWLLTYWLIGYPTDVVGTYGRTCEQKYWWTSLTGWLTNCLTYEWLTTWLTDKLTDTLKDGLTDWLADWWTVWPVLWLTDWLSDCPSDWLTGWLFDCLSVWQTDW